MNITILSLFYTYTSPPLDLNIYIATNIFYLLPYLSIWYVLYVYVMSIVN